MKPAPLDYVRAETLDRAIEILADNPEEGRVIAGGQSLGPLLNLRLASPTRLIDISQIDELRRVSIEEEYLSIGPCITHAQIEDGGIPDVTHGLMPYVASGIAYRAVRNRGTLGGSLAHADPAADWLAAMSALCASVRLRGSHGRRDLKVEEFITGPLSTAIKPAEVIESILVPRLSVGARWGHAKFARKLGDFADSMAIVVIDHDRNFVNAVLAQRTEPPVPLRRTVEQLVKMEPESPIDDAIESDLEALQIGDDDWTLHRAIVRRAIDGAVR